MATITDLNLMLKRYCAEMPEKADTICCQLADVACEESQSVTPVELGNLRNAIQVKRVGEHYELVCRSPYCTFVEFGTGMGRASDAVKDRELMTALGYVVNGSGKGESGWLYYDTNSNRFRFTHGQDGSGFMARGALRARRELSDVVRGVLND